MEIPTSGTNEISGGGGPAGTVQKPRFYDGPVFSEGDVGIRLRYFTYQTEEGFVAGCDMSVMFTVDHPAKAVWPILQDSNAWQNAAGYYYSGSKGGLYSSEELDLGDETFQITVKRQGEPDLEAGPYRVLRVIPEHLIVDFEPIPEDGRTGGVSPGFHAFMLTERDGKTVVTIVMEHASRTSDLSEEEALAFWTENTPEGLIRWRDGFIPTLKQLVDAASEGGATA
jgi:hypothetical protein